MYEHESDLEDIELVLPRFAHDSRTTSLSMLLLLKSQRRARYILFLYYGVRSGRDYSSCTKITG